VSERRVVEHRAGVKGLRVRALVRGEQVAALRHVDRMLGRRAARDPWNAGAWLEKHPGLVLALEDEAGRAWGRAACIPISNQAFRAALADPRALHRLLVPAHVLSRAEALARALDGRGNACVLGFTACDPLTREEDLALAAPLLCELWSLGLGLRPRALLCQTTTSEGELLAAGDGWRQLACQPDPRGLLRTTWVFDVECARQRPSSGLGCLLSNLWPTVATGSSLGLTPAQRRVVFLTACGYSDSEAARSLAVAVGTVRKHWENVLERFREARMGTSGRVTRERVIGFCQQHPVELQVSEPPGLAASLIVP
jgi:hypothetical protein